MSGRDLYIALHEDHLAAAVILRGVFDDFYLDAQNRKGCWASLYAGKVTKIDKKLDAAIIDLGDGLSGLLPAKHVVKKEAKAGVVTPIGDMLSPGETVLVQIRSEARGKTQHENYKIPRLTMRIQDGMAKNAAQTQAPCLISPGLKSFEQALHDYGHKNFDHIFCGDKAVLDMMTKWCQAHQPDLATSKRLRLFKADKPGEKLFDTHDIAGQIADLGEKTVLLPGGGSIIIEPTHAVTMIDVNQGSGEIIATNTEAAREIARQARLRNLSGAILVDFINMPQKIERARLFDLCQDVFANDHAVAAVHGFTRLGIMEITRKRRSATLAEKLKS